MKALIACLVFFAASSASAQTIHEAYVDQKDGRAVSYAIWVPRAYHGDPVPLILALHYGGDPRGAGRDMLRILIQPALGELGAIIVAPDSLDGGWNTAANERAVNALLAEIEKKYAIDQKKVIVTGFSMGGTGTWYWADKYPDRFSAAIPLASRPTPSPDTWRVPVFAVHSRADQTVPIGPVEQRIAVLKQRGLNAQMVIVNGIQHYETYRFVDALRQAVPWVKEIWKNQALTAQTPQSWEAKYRAIPDAKNIGEYIKRMSARPHHLGSPYDKDNAEWILAKFKEWGWDAKIETFDVLFPTPKERLVEMVEPNAFKLKLEEPAVAVDPTSGQKSEQLPSFNAYSIDGDVTGPIVYVNYGRPQDYEDLERRGISVRGAIVLARYGNSWRGIKPKVAAEHGAIGCLIYSDPADDGYYNDDMFPNGPTRNGEGVQRGSVMDMPTYPGDPLTPNAGATADAKRLELKDVATLTKIPVLPISYADAQPLLAALKGPVVPEAWRGALPITYHFGPGPSRVHMKVAFNWNRVPVYDVIARMQGSTFPDEWVIRGNHHDAWVNGAQVPGSGMSAVLEEARALGELAKQGWRPKRTLIYAAWDGEEQALLGSTEWVEAHDKELREHAVAYVNSDGTGRGFFNPSGSHILEKLVNGIARDVEDPETKISVWKRQQARRIANGSRDERNDARTRADLRIAALGSGSDYTSFLQHNGVPSVDLRFGGLDSSDGIYHSIYDDYFYYTKFLDTDFAYGRTLAQVAGTMMMRLADADLLPFDFTNLADTVQTYVKELQALLKTQQDDVRERNRQIEEGVFAAVNDPRRPLQPPKKEVVAPALNFAPLENAAEALTQAAARYQKAADAARESLASNTATLRAVNAKLLQAERQLIDEAGLPKRPWYRHLLYAPGFYTGYAVKTMPGVREAIEQKEYAEADTQIARVAQALEREAALLDSISASLQP